MTSFEATNSVFNITDENNSFSVSTPGQWSLTGSKGTVKGLIKNLELLSQNDIESQAKKIEKKENKYC